MKTIIQALKNEIDWCIKHKSDVVMSEDYKKGFVKGLKQAIMIVKLVNKTKGESK